MDPLSALSLATSIFQLVDFATKIVHGTRQTYESVSGAAEGNADVELCATELRDLCERLQPSAQLSPNNEDDEALCRLADRCISISNDLLAILRRLKAKDPHSKWHCMVSAIKTQIKKSERDELLARLSQCRSQLDTQLCRLNNLDNKAFQQKVLRSLESGDRDFERLLEYLRNLRANVTISSLSPDAEAQLHRIFSLPEESRKTITARRALNLLQFEDMHEQFDDVSVAHAGTFDWALDDYSALGRRPGSWHGRDSKPSIGSSHILPPLCHGSEVSQNVSLASQQTMSGNMQVAMHASGDDVSDIGQAHQRASTRYNEKQQVRRNIFLDWLQHGTGIFHFVGNSGSGKSTLIKYLCENPKTTELLRGWASGSTLILVKFFLCRTGNKKQRSISGLCRALLHDILEARPDLIPKALPEIWKRIESIPWQVEFKPQIRSDYFRDALTQLFQKEADQHGTYFALFIDGIDELDESSTDYGKVVDLLHCWSGSPASNAKICVSSNPLPVFVNGFDDSQRIWMHVQNSDDIRKVVFHRFQIPIMQGKAHASEPHEAHTLQSQNRKQIMAEAIVQRANGDFRWATLAVDKVWQLFESPKQSLPMLRRLRTLSSDISSDISISEPEELEDSLAHFNLDDLVDLLEHDRSIQSSTQWLARSSTAATGRGFAASQAFISRGFKDVWFPGQDEGESQRQSQLKELGKYLGLSEKYEDDLFAVEDARIGGTCEWLSSRPSYQSWRDFTSDVPRILWITGKPGTGKSTLAGYIIDELRNLNTGCSFFFFKYADKSKSLFSACLKSLAYQMARKHPAVRKKLLEIKSDKASLNGDSDNERILWHQLFLDGIFRTFPGTQYWIIDGLDECENSLAAFKTILGKQDKSIPLRILITSRETPNLLSEFSSLGQQHCRKETLSTTDTLADIKLLIEEKAKALVSMDDDTKSALVEKVLAKSRGSMLWTVLVLKELSLSYSEKEVAQVLEDIPQGMKPLYHRTLELMSQSLRGKALAKAILTWTTCAKRPLTIGELDGALKIDLKETYPKLEGIITSLCGQLVTIDKLGRVQMVHETAREFLLQEDLQSEFAVESMSAHTQIAKACLAYLSGEEMKIPRSTRRGGGASAKKRAAFSFYACTSFSYHLTKADPDSRELFTLVDSFLKSNILSWIEEIAKTGDLAPLIYASKNFKTYLDHCPRQEEVRNASAWTTDLIRISAKFADALIAFPAAIYSLIPPFCPTNSAIHRAGKSGRGLSIIGLSNMDWGDRLSCIDFHSQTSSVCHGDRFLAVGLSNGTISLYHAVTGQEYRCLHHGEPVNLSHFINKSGLLATCGTKTIRVWDIATGKIKHTFDAPHRCISLIYDQGLLIAACDKNYLASWDLHNSGTRQPDRPWHPGENCIEGPLRRPPSAISISIRHKMMAAAYPGRPIILWDLEEDSYYGTCGKKLANGETSKHLVTALVFNPNSALELLAVSYLDGELVLLDPFNDETLETTRANCPKLAGSPDGRLLAGAAGFGTIDIYDFESLKLLYRVKSSNLYIKRLDFSRDSLHLVDIRGSQCNVWEPAALHRATIIDGLDKTTSSFVEAVVSETKLKISAVLLSHLEMSIFCGKDDGSVSMYDCETGKQVSILYRHKSRVHILAWMSASTIISVDASNSLLAWNLQCSSGKELALGQQALQARLDCGNTITQLFPASTAGKFILSTRESDHLWTFDGEEEKRRTSDAPGLRKWLQHPRSSSHVICVDGATVRIYTLSDWSEVTCYSTSIDMTNLQLKSVIPCIANRTQALFIELSELHGGADTRKIHLLDADSLGFETTASSSTDADAIRGASEHYQTSVPLLTAQLGNLSNCVSHIIGVSDANRLVFLDKHSWVCSAALEFPDSVDLQYSRHFFVPYDWFSGTRDVLCAVSRRDVLFARNDNVAIVRGGFDYSGTITVV